MNREPDIRFSESQLKDPDILSMIWDDSYVRLCHMANLLESEGVIETPTANRIRQCALDFKICLDYLIDLTKKD
jgi:hypothetical protein